MPQFNDPSPGGDKLPLDELLGALLLFIVHESMPEMQTTFGPATPIRADVAVLDGARKGDTFDDTLVFPRVLQGQLRPSVGGMVLGRLAQGVKKAGQSAPWTLDVPTDDDRATGTKYLAHVATLTAAQEEPF